MPASAFRQAHEGKVYRGTLDLVAEQEVNCPIKGSGVGGGLKDYSIIGIPIGCAQDLITFGTAVEADTHTIVVRGQTFTITVPATPTSGGNRNLMKTLLDAAATALDVVIAAVSTAQLSITAKTPGRALGTTVTGSVPANMTLAKGLPSGTAPVQVIDKSTGSFTVRAAAATTARFDIVIVG